MAPDNKTVEGIPSFEQLILLPTQPTTFTVASDESATVQIHTGMHTVVFSGLIGPINEGGFTKWTDDDDEVHTYHVQGEVGPLWRDVSQASSCVGIGAILSLDSDSVDHSRWTIESSSWDVVDTPDGKRIRLLFTIKLQGQGNGWGPFAYQVVATGDLRRMPRLEELSVDM